MAEEIKASKLTDDEIISYLTPDIDKARGLQDELGAQRERYYSAFRCAKYGNERPKFSQSIAPVIYTNHQSRTSALLEIFSDEFFALKGDDADRALKFQKLIRYQMFRKQDGNKRLYDFLYDAGLYHYAVFKVSYKEDYDLKDETFDRLSADQMMQLAQEGNRTITKYDEVQDEMGGTAYEKVKTVLKEVLYAGPWFEAVPPWQWFYSPDCKITEWGGIDGRLVYHEVKLTLDDIRKRERAGIYDKGTYKKCEDIGGSTSTVQAVDEVTILHDADDLSDHATGLDNDDILQKELSVKECYAKMDFDGDGLLESCIVVLIEDQIVARIEENPYKRPPFRVGSMIPDAHKVHGIALPGVLENDQKVQTNLIRFAQDMAAISTYRNPITSDPRMQKMLSERAPGDCILGDPTKIGEVPVQQADTFILKAIELLKGDVEESSGDSRLNQGTDSQSINKTAQGATLISQSSMRRLRMSAKLIGNGPMTGLIRDFIFINQKWKGKDPIRLLGTDITVNPEDLDGEYDIDIDIGVSPAEKQASANQVDLFVQFATQAGMQMGITDPVMLVKAIKKKYALLGINMDDVMISEQVMKQKMEEQKQQPPKEDWKEFVQMDKLYGLLARSEQVQILQKMGIQPDPNAQVAGIPSAKDMLAAQAKQGDSQAKVQAAQQMSQIKGAEAQQKMQMEREKHGMDLQGKQIDLQGKVAAHQMNLESAKQKGQNDTRRADRES